MSADSAMKCTPQKTMNSASGRAAASRASLNESPVTSANAIDLVALVVVPEHEGALAERGTRDTRALDEVGVARAPAASPTHSTPRSEARSTPRPSSRSAEGAAR